MCCGCVLFLLVSCWSLNGVGVLVYEFFLGEMYVFWVVGVFGVVVFVV